MLDERTEGPIGTDGPAGRTTGGPTDSDGRMDGRTIGVGRPSVKHFYNNTN